jgi:hypothetical protein
MNPAFQNDQIKLIYSLLQEVYNFNKFLKDLLKKKINTFKFKELSHLLSQEYKKILNYSNFSKIIKTNIKNIPIINNFIIFSNNIDQTKLDEYKKILDKFIFNNNLDSLNKNQTTIYYSIKTIFLDKIYNKDIFGFDLIYKDKYLLFILEFYQYMNYLIFNKITKYYDILTEYFFYKIKKYSIKDLNTYILITLELLDSFLRKYIKSFEFILNMVKKDKLKNKTTKSITTKSKTTKPITTKPKTSKSKISKPKTTKPITMKPKISKPITKL